MLTLQNVTKQFTDKKHKVTVNALRGINLSFAESGLNFVLGKTGCGKTTLLNLIAGIDTHTTGSIVYEGKSFHDFSARDFERYRNCVVGCIFQEYYLIPYYTVGENVKFALDLLNDGRTEEEKIALVNETLKRVELVDENGDPIYNRSITGLSGGQKQRVAIARAIIKKPKILLADEPTGALDFETGRDIFKLLKELSSERLVIVVTHDEKIAYDFGDRVIRLERGLVIDDTAPDTAEPGGNARGVRDFSPGKLTLPHCIKLGASALTRKRFRLATALLSSVLALLVLSLGLLIGSPPDPNAVRLNRQYEERTYAILEGDTKRRDPYGDNSFISYSSNIYDERGIKKQEWQEYGLMPIYVSHNSIERTVPLTEREVHEIMRPSETPDTYDLHWNAAFSDYYGFLPADESLGLRPDGRFEDKSLCRTPATVDEVAISDIKADAYIRCGFVDADGVTHTIQTPDDLIGLQFKNTFRKIDNTYEEKLFTICGVFSTPDSEFVKNSFPRDDSYESIRAYDCSTESSVVNYFYACPGFYEKINEWLDCKTNDERRFLLPLTHGYASDIAFLKEMNFQEVESYDNGNLERYDSHFLKVLSIYDVNVHAFEGAVPLFEPYVGGVVCLFILLPILFMINYLVGSIHDRRKEFGILLGLGAGKGSIYRIFFAECIIIGAITFFVSYGAIWLIALVVNVFFFHMTYFLIGWLTTLIIFACSVGCTAVASLFSLLSIRSLTPKGIINAADSGK